MQFWHGKTPVFCLWPVVTLNEDECGDPQCSKAHTTVALTFAGYAAGVTF